MKLARSVIMHRGARLASGAILCVVLLACATAPVPLLHADEAAVDQTAETTPDASVEATDSRPQTDGAQASDNRSAAPDQSHASDTAQQSSDGSIPERGAAETAALTAAQQQYDEAREQLQEIGAQLEQTQYDLNETQSLLEQLGADIEQTRSDIDDTTQQLETAQNALAAYLIISYKSGSANILDLLFQSTDFNDFVTRTYYVTMIQNSQVNAINDIRTLKERLEEQEQLLSTQQDQQAELEAQLQAQEQELTQRHEESNQLVASLSAEVQALFEAQQSELLAAAEARTTAANASTQGAASGYYTPGESLGSIVEDAYACLGIPYIWGGDDESFADPDPEVGGGYDCSGFVQHLYALQGYTIGRTTWDQIAEIQALGNWVTSVDELEPGDLVFPNDGHVGVYIGNGQMIDAPYPGAYIQVDPIEEFIGGGSPIPKS